MDAGGRLPAITDGTIGVGTVRNMIVPVDVEVVDAEPQDPFTEWDQVNECSIDVKSGRIVIAGCTDYFPDAVRADETAALLAVCHTFGVVCRWLDLARPVLRGPDKGGKSIGVQANVLTPEAERHPWFSRLAVQAGGSRVSVVDSRLFDLIPVSDSFPPGVVPLGYEARPDGTRGDAITMIEVARDRGGTMPRMLAVNHHPEIRDREMQRALLERKLARSEVSAEWVEERNRIIADVFRSRESEASAMLASYFTLLGPLRFHLYRQVRLRAAALGVAGDLDEERVLGSIPVVADPDAGLPA